jgi:fatty acid desaturase
MPKSSLAGHVASPALHTLLIRRKIRRQLSSELFLPSPRRTIVALAIAATIVMTSSTLIAVPQLGIGGIFLSFLCGFLYASLFFLGHEAGHGSILRSGLGQYLLMSIAFIVFLLSPTLWCVWHNKVHHAHTNIETHDPDNFGTLPHYMTYKPARIIASLTPGSMNWLSILYLPIWFTAHAQFVLWIQSHRCRGFASLNRRRAISESLLMTAFWILLGWELGPWLALTVIVIPMMIANTIIMSYIATNHLLRPLVDEPDMLESSMSVTTHPLLDLIHFNFSHHVEHHFFPSMSSKHAPRVRKELRQHAQDRFLAPPHWAALLMVFRTPRIHDGRDALLDPRSGARVPFIEITESLREHDR